MITRAETLGRVGIWLADLTFGGRTFRFSTQAIEVPTDAGALIRYDLGLEDFDHDLSDSGIDLAIGVSINADQDWAALVASGVQIERAAGVLRRHFPGQTIERSRVIVRGICTDVEYGAADEPLELSIMSAPIELSDTIPPPTWTVGPDTWPVDEPVFDSKIEGAQYPVVIGYPGTLGDGIGAPAVPGLAADLQATGAGRRASKILIAGGRIHASNVGLWDMTDTPNSQLRQVIPASDLLGQSVSHVDFVGGGGSFPPLADRSWYVSFDIANGGGVWNADHSAALRGAGEVLRHFMRTHTQIPIDEGRMVAESARLDTYKIDTFINAGVNAWEFCQGIAELIPVIPVQTSRGLYWRYLNWNAGAVDAVAHLTAGAGLERASPVSGLGDPIYNEITVEFAPFATSQKFRKRIIVTAQRGQRSAAPAGLSEDPRIFENLRCVRSQLIYGVKPYTYRAPAIWDDATAGKIARDLANRFALPHRVIAYVGGPELEILALGDVITLTDVELSITAAPALVWEVTIGDGREVAIVLVLIDSPISTDRKVD